jgi:hypothetical protein
MHCEAKNATNQAIISYNTNKWPATWTWDPSGVRANRVDGVGVFVGERAHSCSGSSSWRWGGSTAWSEVRTRRLTAISGLHPVGECRGCWAGLYGEWFVGEIRWIWIWDGGAWTRGELTLRREGKHPEIACLVVRCVWPVAEKSLSEQKKPDISQISPLTKLPAFVVDVAVGAARKSPAVYNSSYMRHAFHHKLVFNVRVAA